MAKERLEIKGIQRFFYSYSGWECFPLILSVVAGLFFYGQKHSPWLAAAGFGLWTLVEYCIHRFLFHSRPKTQFLKDVVNRAHIYHHIIPEDSRVWTAGALFILPWVTIISGVILLSTWSLEMTSMILSGFLLGYAFYELMHRQSHGQEKHFLWWKRHHMAHHFGSWRHNFGVTSPFWDLIFRTYRR